MLGESLGRFLLILSLGSSFDANECLSLSVPPGRPLIHNERGILVEEILGPYNEGAELMLTCSVSGGKD